MQTLRLRTPQWHLSSHKAQSCTGCVNQNNLVIKTKESIQLGRPSADTYLHRPPGHSGPDPSETVPNASLLTFVAKGKMCNIYNMLGLH